MEEKPLLRPLLDAFEEGVCLLDEAGTVRCMNAAAERLLGYREDELLGRSFLSDLEVAQEGGAPQFGVGEAFDRLSPFRQEPRPVSPQGRQRARSWSARYNRWDETTLVRRC